METECIICKSPIKFGAAKCLACGGMQNWTRFLDIGNTSLSLIIALVSVFALASTHMADLLNYFSDKKIAHITGKIISAKPNELSVYLDNDGPGIAIIPNGALCDVWPVKKAWDLWEPNNSDKRSTVRYPKLDELVGRYIYFYDTPTHKPLIISQGEKKIVTFPIRELLFRKEMPNPRNRENVKSYCEIQFLNENGNDDMIFNVLEPLEVSFFSLDDKETKKAILKYQSHKDKP